MQNEWIFHSPKLEEQKKLEEKQREEQSRQDEKRQDEKRREEQSRQDEKRQDEKRREEQKRSSNKRELQKDGVKEMVKLTVKNKPNYEDVVQKMLDRAKNHGADLSKIEVKGEPKFIDSSRQALQAEMKRDKARWEEMKVEAYTKQELSKWAKEAEQNKAPQKQAEQTQKTNEAQKRQELEKQQAEQNKQKERQR